MAVQTERLGVLRCIALAAGCALVACAEPEGRADAAVDAALVPTPSHCSDGHSHSHSHGDSEGCSDGAAGAAARDAGADASDGGYVFQLPSAIAPPRVPADNPMSAAKVELGRHLFYDKNLSGNKTQACASCHKQERAFADERAVGLGSTGELHTRSSMSLANVAYSPTLTWGHPLMTTLEKQLRVPLFGDAPIELGMKSISELEERLRAVPRYRELFGQAFPNEPEPITMLNVERALASFERTLLSFSSPFDRYFYGGDESALSDSAKRGMVFVTTNQDHRFECNHCHGGPNFSDHHADATTLDDAPLLFHQTGLYNIDGLGGYPAPNSGIHEITGRPSDIGMFKAPTLRNVALTAPYMHDGSIASLSEVLDHYAKGGRARVRGRTDDLLQPFPITEQERADIIAFLESLTDEKFITNPSLSDPFLPSQPAASAKPPQ
jgi:cytochrome c peroxidase